MLTALIVIPALCAWTGFGLIHLLPIKRTSLDMVLTLFLCVVSGVLVLGWVAIIAAELGIFHAEWIIALGVIIGAAGAWRAKQRGLNFAIKRTSRLEAAFLIGLLGVMIALYFRPHEFIFGGADAGVYVNLGAQISRSGRWLISNPDFSTIPPADYAMLFREQPPPLIPHYYHLPGFYIADGHAGEITPQFFPLHPVWLAVAYGVRGLGAALFMTPLWGILGVLAVYFAVREAFHDGTLAALAAGLLALTPLQIWFARYPTAETLTQFLIFAGLFGLARFMRRDEAWAGVLGGVAFGQVMLVRIDTYFVLGVPLVYAAYLYVRRRLNWRFALFAGPMILLAIHSLVHARWQGWPYFYNSFIAGESMLPAFPILMTILIGVAAIYLAFKRWTLAHPDWPTRARPIWRGVLTIAAIGLIGLGLYAYFILPLSADVNKQSPYWYSESTIPNVEPFNFVRLGWYLSPLGLALSVLGLAWLVREHITETGAALLGVGLFFTILYVNRTYNNPHHIYVMRRYVPAVIPTLTLGMAYPLVRMFRWRPLGRGIAIGLGALLLALLIYAGRIIIPQVDYQGGIDQYRAFVQRFPPRSIILFDDDLPVGTAGLFGTPLAYLDQQTVIDLQEDRIDAPRLDALIARWLTAGRTVMIVKGLKPAANLCERWPCQALGAAHFKWPQLESSYEHFPLQVNTLEYSLEIWRLSAPLP
jgi:4-amino-4-deoxy-L-arabinose transferase-like glycosyltransferase